MRVFTVTCLALMLCFGLATAIPTTKRIEDTKATELVDRQLDKSRITDNAPSETPGENVDRAKKQASTTFCVEIRQNKQVPVDCDDLNKPVIPAPPPPIVEPPQPSVVIVPNVEPLPPSPPPVLVPVPNLVPPPQPPVMVIPQPVQNWNVEPCQPEIAAYLVQPPSQIVYVPTGNCARHGSSAYPLIRSSYQRNLDLSSTIPSFKPTIIQSTGVVPSVPTAQSLRISRNPDEKDAEEEKKEQEENKEKEQVITTSVGDSKKPSPSQLMEQMLKTSADDDSKSDRVARFFVPKQHEESNNLFDD